MRKNPLFTIVIANYNHGKFIEQAILSVVNQGFNNFELIVIDAESNDNSVEVIKKYSDNIAWWVSEPDSGQSEAFNKGFRKAKGKYLFWLNADDVLLKNSLSIVNNFLEKNIDTDWISGNTIYYDVEGFIKKCTNGPNWNNLAFKNGPINIYGPTSIFSKKIFDKVGGFDESLHFGMDTDLWLRFKANGFKFVKIKQYFWGFRVHEDSKTSHAFSTNQSNSFKSESRKIRLKNNVEYNNFGVYFQQLIKLLNGNYIKSFIDSRRYFNKNIKNY